MMRLISSFFKDESGATMVEYAILVALISIAAILIIYTLGQQINNTFNTVMKCIVGNGSCS
jgi:pilus assembly protein Flp/PilA